MTSRFPAAAVLAAAFVLLSSPVAAACSTARTGAACVVAVPAAATAPALAIGERLDRGRYSILLNAEYYGLPPVADGWVYMRVGRDVYRVHWASHEVMERVTDLAAANF